MPLYFVPDNDNAEKIIFANYFHHLIFIIKY